MTLLIDFEAYPVRLCLNRLLWDKSSGENIIWATNNYDLYGVEFDDRAEIKSELFSRGFVLEPRTAKSAQTQLERTRKRAEVYTPAWLVNKMNNYMDAEWFGRDGVFNIEKGEDWEPVYDRIIFPNGRTWQEYVDSTRIEITCGEGPFLVSRYDAATSELIRPIHKRVGILDRKLRIVGENAKGKEEWVEWATRAVQATYGYEYQGDSLLLARINVLLTFVEYYEKRFKEKVPKTLLFKISNIIAWNLWQMDGLTDTIPLGAHEKPVSQMTIFDMVKEEDDKPRAPIACRIYDRRANKSQTFSSLKEEV